MPRQFSTAQALPRREEQTQRAPEIRHKKIVRPKSMVYFIEIFTCGLLILTLLGMTLYGRVELSRIVAEQSGLTDQLEELDKDNQALSAELEAQSGLTNVEDYAENTLGLQKLDKAQIEYVEIPKSTVIEVVQTEDKSFWGEVKDWFGDVMEYFGA
ncbi:MAG: hypothetical protein QM689_09460 [Oscillospiraceae bacterium]